MKVRTFTLFIFMLFSLVACVEAPPEEISTRSSEPLRCSEFRDTSCDMNWYIISNADSFPKNVELLINEKVIFNECSRDVNVSVSRTNFNVEIIIYKFANLSAGVPFSFTVNDLGDCYSDKTQYYNRSIQPYEIKEINSGAGLIIRI